MRARVAATALIIMACSSGCGNAGCGVPINNAIGASKSLHLSSERANTGATRQDQEVWVSAKQDLVANLSCQPLRPLQFDHVVIGNPRIDKHSQPFLENSNGLVSPDRHLYTAGVISRHEIIFTQRDAFEPESKFADPVRFDSNNLDIQVNFSRGEVAEIFPDRLNSEADQRVITDNFGDELEYTELCPLRSERDGNVVFRCGGRFCGGKQRLLHISGLDECEKNKSQCSNSDGNSSYDKGDGRPIETARVFGKLGSQINKPPIEFRLFTAFAALFFCLVCAFMGWLSVYDGRRARGCILLGMAGFIGFGGLWLFLLSPRMWGWLL